MKPKTASFDAQNRRIARLILQNEAKYGSTSLLVRWARLTLERAQGGEAPKAREARQPGLFGEPETGPEGGSYSSATRNSVPLGPFPRILLGEIL